MSVRTELIEWVKIIGSVLAMVIAVVMLILLIGKMVEGHKTKDECTNGEPHVFGNWQDGGARASSPAWQVRYCTNCGRSQWEYHEKP